jgi:hypothetical protein
MYFESSHNETNVILIGRESDISVIVIKQDGQVKIKLLLRNSIEDQSSHNTVMDAMDGVATIYKLWTDGNLFPVKTLLHLQNDIINYLQEQLLTVQSIGGKVNGNS